MRLFHAAKLKHVRVTVRTLAMLVVAVVLLVPAVAAGDRGARASQDTGRVGAKTTATRKTNARLTSRRATSVVEVVGGSSSTISLKWSPGDNGTSYIVTRNGNAALSTRRTYATVGSLSCSTSYRLKVDAVRKGVYRTIGETGASTTACSPSAGVAAPIPAPVPAPAPAPDSQPPSVPTGLVKTDATATAVSISWSASTDNVGVVGYGIYVDGASTGTQAGTSFTLGSLACGTNRTLGVDAVDAAGNRSARTEASFSTQACTSAPPTTSCDAVASPGVDKAQALYASLKAGQTGCLHGGTYTSSSSYVLHMAKPDVTIVSFPGERALLHGTIASIAERNRLAGVSILGVAASDAVKIYSKDFTLESSDISGDHLTTCVMVGSTGGGLALRPVIRRNVFHDCGNPANGNKDHSIYAAYTQGALVTENVFYNQSAYAIQMYPNCQGMVFSHNVIDGGGDSVRGGIAFASETSGVPSSGNIVEYNIVTYAASSNITSYWGGTPGTGNIARNNVLYGAVNGNFGNTVGYTQSNNLIADPLFVDRAGHDYRLRSGSPALAVVGFDTAARLR